MAGFMFASGIENSYSTILLPDGSTHRVDEMAKTGHYDRWREDFQLAKALGITPIADLCHFGVGVCSTMA